MSDLAVLAEEAGWDGFFVWDHLRYPAPVREILDPYICLAVMAARTSRIRLGPGPTSIISTSPCGASVMRRWSRGKMNASPSAQIQESRGS